MKAAGGSCLDFRPRIEPSGADEEIRSVSLAAKLRPFLFCAFLTNLKARANMSRKEVYFTQLENVNPTTMWMANKGSVDH